MKNRLLLILAALLLPVSTFAQTADRIIQRPEHPQSGPAVINAGAPSTPTDVEALEIVDLLVEGKPIKIGERFSAGADWLKTLSVRLRNASDKPIASLRIHFILPETKADNATSGFSLQYGKELSTGIDYGPQRVIAPNEVIEITRNERHFVRDEQGLAKRTNLRDFKLLTLGYAVVRFQDGSGWATGRPVVKSEIKR